MPISLILIPRLGSINPLSVIYSLPLQTRELTEQSFKFPDGHFKVLVKFHWVRFELLDRRVELASPITRCVRTFSRSYDSSSLSVSLSGSTSTTCTTFPAAAGFTPVTAPSRNRENNSGTRRRRKSKHPRGGGDGCYGGLYRWPRLH